MKKLIIILSLLFVFASCKVAFVPTASTSIKAQVTAVSVTTDSLFAAEQTNSDKSFATYQPTYLQLQTAINSIQSQDSARIKPALLLAQVARLKNTFTTIIATHQSKGVLNNAQIETYRGIMSGLWLPIINSENVLK